MTDAQRCNGCSRMTYDVKRVALLVDGQFRCERALCVPCRTNAIDGFQAAEDGLVIRKAQALRA